MLEEAKHQGSQRFESVPFPSDAINVFVTLTAREMNPHMKIVSRAASESSISKLRRAGANQIILPHVIGGRKMTNLITRPSLGRVY